MPTKKVGLILSIAQMAALRKMARFGAQRMQARSVPTFRVLLRRGLVELNDDLESWKCGRYQITDAGRKALAEQMSSRGFEPPYY